jgi:Uncharacterized protein encoded in hypervariable junctions of pilus gene clusters
MDINDRINAIEEINPDEIDLKMLAEAEEINDETTVPYKEFIKNLEDHSGKLSLRIPRSLHAKLKEQARLEGVSLNQYALYKLSK